MKNSQSVELILANMHDASRQLMLILDQALDENDVKPWLLELEGRFLYLERSMHALNQQISQELRKEGEFHD